VETSSRGWFLSSPVSPRLPFNALAFTFHIFLLMKEKKVTKREGKGRRWQAWEDK